MSGSLEINCGTTKDGQSRQLSDLDLLLHCVCQQDINRAIALKTKKLGLTLDNWLTLDESDFDLLIQCACQQDINRAVALKTIKSAK
jgi:predicted nucleotidyltransferase